MASFASAALGWRLEAALRVARRVGGVGLLLGGRGRTVALSPGSYSGRAIAGRNGRELTVLLLSFVRGVSRKLGCCCRFVECQSLA